MKTVKAKSKQTIMDVALEQYGTLEAIGEIMAINPGLTNDPVALVALGIDAMTTTDFFMDVALEPGIDIAVDESSDMIRGNVLKQITAEITTFDI